MSEKIQHNIDKGKELHNKHEHSLEHRRIQHEHEKREIKHHTTESLKNLEKNVEHHALSRQAYEKPMHEHKTENHHGRISKDIKDITFERTLTRTRKKLNPAERALSKIVHRPAVERISEVASNTIARPSGLLGAGLLAGLGTVLFLLIIRHHGYDYNYLVMLMLFVIGYFAGATLEIVVRILRKK